MALVADTGALYALYDADDLHHAAVRQVVEGERGVIIIPVVILAELVICCVSFLASRRSSTFLMGSPTALTLCDVQFAHCQLAHCFELNKSAS